MTAVTSASTAWRKSFGGEAVANHLVEAIIIINKNLIPADPAAWNRPSGLRIGTTDVTRWGMKEAEMARIADLMVDVLQQRRPVEAVRRDAVDMRQSFPTLQYRFATDQ